MLVLLHPVMDGLERVAVEPVQPLASLVTHVDRPHLSEHPQVLGYLRLRQPEQAHQIIHGTLPASEDVQNLSTPGLSHRVERVRCGRRSCHRKIIFLYENISSPRQWLDGERVRQDAEATVRLKDVAEDRKVIPVGSISAGPK